MKYIDWLVQTGLLIVTLVVSAFRIGDNQFFITLMAYQFFVGVWQLASSLYSVAKEGSYSPKKNHLFISLIYLAVLFIAPAFEKFISGPDFPKWIWKSYLLGPPWILAIYHYVLTWRMAFSNRRRSSNFLPHINF